LKEDSKTRYARAEDDKKIPLNKKDKKYVETSYKINSLIIKIVIIYS
jgi:hypothetical protein